MSVNRWLKEELLSWFRPRAHARSANRRPQRLTLEELEARCVLTYTVTDLGTFGGTLSFAYGINNRGQVVGAADFACNCNSDPFLWDQGILSDLGNLGLGGQSGAFGINDLGQVVGDSGSHPFFWSRESGMNDFGFVGGAGKINEKTQIAVGMPVPPYGAIHGFLWTNGRMLDVGNLNGDPYDNTAPSDINNKGQMVGQAFAGCTLHGYFWQASTGMSDLGAIDGDPCNDSNATAINDYSQIVGYSYSKQKNVTHAVYFSAQGVVDLGSLGGYSLANAINTAGQVVGQYSAGLYNHAFLTDLTSMHMVNLNDLIPPDSGWNLFDATGINDVGQIVGTGQLPGVDIIHSYLLTPDPPLAGMLMQTLAAGPEPFAFTGTTSSADCNSIVFCQGTLSADSQPRSDDLLQPASKALATSVYRLREPGATPVDIGTDGLADGLSPNYGVLVPPRT
jgi:probable HAF family extracellular repeat protein